MSEEVTKDRARASYTRLVEAGTKLAALAEEADAAAAEFPFDPQHRALAAVLYTVAGCCGSFGLVRLAIHVRPFADGERERLKRIAAGKQDVTEGMYG